VVLNHTSRPHLEEQGMRPTTAHEWWLQERENQLDMAKRFYDLFGNKSATMWHCLFAWATPDIWRDPEPRRRTLEMPNL
jgi:hypothetical protein